MGVKLFHRGAKKITLTSEGVLLRRRAEEILSLVDRTAQELMEQDELVEGRVVIGGGELAAMRLLPEIIQSFREKYPRVTFDIFTGNADIVKEQMEKGLIDIGVLLDPIDMEKFDFIRLRGREQWVVLMRLDDPLAEKESIRAQDLENAPLILLRRTNVQNELINWLGDSFQESQVLFTSNLPTNGALMVQQGLAYRAAGSGSCGQSRNTASYRVCAAFYGDFSFCPWDKCAADAASVWQGRGECDGCLCDLLADLRLFLSCIGNL